MANADRERRLTLLAEVDPNAARQGEQRIAALREQFEGLERAEGDAAQAGRRSNDVLGDLGRGQQVTLRFLEARIEAERKITQNLQEEIRLLREESTALRQRQAGGGIGAKPAAGVGFQAADQFNALLRQRAGLLGDVDTALQTVGGAVSGFAPGLAGGVRGAGDIFAVAEALPQLQGALSGLPATIQSVATAMTGSGGLTTSLAATIGPVATVGGAALIAAPALIAMGFAIKKFIERIEEGKAQLAAAIDAQTLYYDTIAGGTTESIQQQLEELKIRQQARELERAALQEQIEGLTILQRLIGGGQFRKRLKDVDTELSQTGSNINALERALQDGGVQARSAAEAADQAASSTDQLQTVEQARDSVLAQVTQTTEDATAAETERQQAVQQTALTLRELNTQVTAGAQDRRALQAETDQLLRDQAREGYTRVNDLVAKSQEAFGQASRKLEEDLRQLEARAKMSIFESGLDRDFAAISRTRRGLSFDETSRRRDFQIDQINRSETLQRELAQERLGIEQKLLDLARQRLELELQARQAQINALLQARGLNTGSTVFGLSGLNALVDQRIAQVLS